MARPPEDVTNQVEFGPNRGSFLPLYKCVCGIEFEPWEFRLETGCVPAKKCPGCGDRMYFEVEIKVFRIRE
jgi:hypothetical protein